MFDKIFVTCSGILGLFLGIYLGQQLLDKVDFVLIRELLFCYIGLPIIIGVIGLIISTSILDYFD